MPSTKPNQHAHEKQNTIKLAGKWMLRGKQKQALARALRTPMTAQQLTLAMKPYAEKVQLPEVINLLKTFMDRNLIQCLSPRESRGRLYFFTTMGLTVVNKTFDTALASGPEIDWKRYAPIAKGPIRQAVLRTFFKHAVRSPLTVAAVRKELRHKLGLGLSGTIRVVKVLSGLKLIRCIGITKAGRKLYRITAAGKRIVAKLNQDLQIVTNQPFDSPPFPNVTLATNFKDALFESV